MKSFLAGLLGGVLIVSIALFIVFSMKLHVYNVQIINPKMADSLDNYVSKVQLIKEMEKDGLLLSPQEYTSNITSYYNTAITLLVFLFILFSILSYFHLKNSSKELIQEQILKTFEEKIKDSKEVEQIIMDTFAGRADDIYATVENVDYLSRRVEKHDIAILSLGYDIDDIEDETITIQ